VLPDAGHVNEADIHHPDVVFFDNRQDFLWCVALKWHLRCSFLGCEFFGEKLIKQCTAITMQFLAAKSPKPRAASLYNMHNSTEAAGRRLLALSSLEIAR
jgi:hypothetical protein